LGALLDLLAQKDGLGVWDRGLDLLRRRILPRQKQSVRWLLASMFREVCVIEEGPPALLEVCRLLGPDLFEDQPPQRAASSANVLLEQLASLLKEPHPAVRRLAARLLLDHAHLGREESLLRRLGECASDIDGGMRGLALTALKRRQEKESPP